MVGLKSEWLELLARGEFEPIPSRRPLGTSCVVGEDVDELAPLVPLEPRPGLVARPHYYQKGVPGASPVIRLRAPLIARLGRAASLLPAGFQLAVVDGWRSEATQRGVYRRIC